MLWPRSPPRLRPADLEIDRKIPVRHEGGSVMAKLSSGDSNRSQAEDESLAKFASRALDAFRDDNADAYKELVEAFEGRSADLSVFGRGRFNVTVAHGEVRIEPRMKGGAEAARGAIYPETLVALAEGRMTPLEAHFKGDLIARAPSADLHLAYGYFVKFAESAMQSERLQELLKEFQGTMQ